MRDGRVVLDAVVASEVLEREADTVSAGVCAKPDDLSQQDDAAVREECSEGERKAVSFLESGNEDARGESATRSWAVIIMRLLMTRLRDSTRT